MRQIDLLPGLPLLERLLNARAGRTSRDFGSKIYIVLFFGHTKAMEEGLIAM